MSSFSARLPIYGSYTLFYTFSCSHIYLCGIDNNGNTCEFQQDSEPFQVGISSYSQLLNEIDLSASFWLFLYYESDIG